MALKILESEFEVKVHQKPEPRRKDSFWFDGHVADVTRNGNTINIVAMGETRVYFKEDGPIYENRAARAYAKKAGWTDKKMKSWDWENNNWFGFYLTTKDSRNGDYFIEFTAGNYDDAINAAKNFLSDLCRWVNF